MSKPKLAVYRIYSLIGILLTLVAAASVSTASCWFTYQPKAPKNLNQ